MSVFRFVIVTKPVKVALLLAAQILLALPSAGQIVRKFPDRDVNVTAVSQAGGSVWLATPRGAYRVDGDTSVRVPDSATDVAAVDDVDGVAWLATTSGAFRIDGDHATRVPDRAMVVTSVVKAGGHIWLATPKGAFRLDGDPGGDPAGVTMRRIPDVDVDVTGIVPAGGDVWIASSGAAYLVHGDRAAHLPNFDYGLNVIQNVAGNVWIATDKGGFRYSDGVLHRETHDVAGAKGVDPHEIFGVENLLGKIWMITRHGAYRVTNDIGQRLPNIDVTVSSIGVAAGHVWVCSLHGAYRIDGDRAVRIPDAGIDALAVADVDGQAWIAAHDGLYRVSGDTAAKFPGIDVGVTSVLPGNPPWIATSDGAFAISGDEGARIPDVDQAVLSLQRLGSDIWLTAPSGAFRIEPGARIDVRPVLAAGGWQGSLQAHLPGWLRLTGRYKLVAGLAGRPEGRPTDPRGVQAIFDADPGFRADVAHNRYVDIGSASAQVEPGFRDLRVRLRDDWSPPIALRWRALFLPAWAMAAGLAVVAWLLVTLVVFAAAPSLDFANDLIMRRAFRNAASLGLIPLLLAVLPAARRHLLRRYRRAVAADPAFASEVSGASNAIDLIPFDLMTDLDAGAIVRLEAGEGIDLPRYQRYLAGCYARDRDGLKPRGLLPVALDPDEVEQGIESGIVRKLGVLGRLTDPGLARRLIERQPLLVLADLSAADPSRLLREHFASRRSQDRYCVLTPGPIDVDRKQVDFEMRPASRL